MSAPKPKLVHDNNTTRIAILETTILHIHETLSRIEKRFDKVDQQFDNVKNEFRSVRDEIRDIRRESWLQFRWVMGAIFFGIFVPIVLKGVHWL